MSPWMSASWHPIGLWSVRMHCHTSLSLTLASDNKRGRPYSHTKWGNKSAQGLCMLMKHDQCKGCELQADVMEKQWVGLLWDQADLPSGPPCCFSFSLAAETPVQMHEQLGVMSWGLQNLMSTGPFFQELRISSRNKTPKCDAKWNKEKLLEVCKPELDSVLHSFNCDILVNHVPFVWISVYLLVKWAYQSPPPSPSQGCYKDQKN